jgi:hypothetical protein
LCTSTGPKFLHLDGRQAHKLTGALKTKRDVESMAGTAVSELQQQIEEVRRAAFAAGYASAMQAIRELASRPLPGAATPSSRPRARGRVARKSATTSSRRRQARPSDGAARPPRSAARRPQRGTNAQSIQEVLQAVAPRALRQAEIRKALQEKGIEVSFTSLRHALGQLEARQAAEQIGSSRTWRHRGNGR